MQEKEVILDQNGNPIYEVFKIDPNAKPVRERIYGSLPLMRVGFLSPVPPRYLEDGEYIHNSQPIAWPIMHPYWVVRQSIDANMIMAYVESLDDVTTFWPEATEITVFEENVREYTFMPKFPKPSWLDEVHADDFEVKPARIGVWTARNVTTGQVLIGYSDDVDYAIQLNNHKLEYGVHEDTEFQKNYTSWQELELQFRPTKDLEAAEKLATQLRDFEHNEGEIETTLYTGDGQ